MLVEMVPRGVPDPGRDPFTKLISDHLVRALTELDTPPVIAILTSGVALGVHHARLAADRPVA